ncbi:MAG: hypothetical protein ISP41_09835 [Alphaproteobacteria bacterium]|nr:hypothetical protein [Alphaproteobacteria bacterium]
MMKEIIVKIGITKIFSWTSKKIGEFYFRHIKLDGLVMESSRRSSAFPEIPYFEDKVVFFWEAKGEPPAIEADGVMEMPLIGKFYVSRLALRLPFDELQAVATREPQSPGRSQNRLFYRSAKYSEVETLRRYGHKPPVVGAGAVVCCEETQEIALFRRASNLPTHAGYLHVFGGCLIPRNTGAWDAQGLSDTVWREVIVEELGLGKLIKRENFDFPNQYFCCKEVSLGYINYYWLGVNIKRDIILDGEGSPEGEPLLYSLSDTSKNLVISAMI